MYKHTQPGWTTVIFFVPVFAGIAVAYFLSGQIWVLAVAAAFALILLQFFSITASVDDEAIRISMGIGLIRKTIPLAEVAAASPVRNKWWFGWGVRYLGPEGWMYNVSGLDAVALEYTSGKKFRIGTDDPEGLARAITSRLA